MDPSPEQVSAMADELSSLAKIMTTQTDAGARRRQTHSIVMKAKGLINQIQDPFEAAMDHVTNFFVISSIRSLMEIGVFEAIPATGSIGVHELATKCDADAALIIRLMRQVNSVGIFDETRTSEWSHNRLSLVMSQHAGLSGKYFIEVVVDEMLPAIARFQAYMRRFGKKDVLTYTDTPHSWAHDRLGRNFWEVLTEDPKRVEAFGRGLSLFEAGYPVLGLFPFEEKLKSGNSPERTFAVDVGGGHGLALLEMRKGCPSLQGKMVLQERKPVLDAIAPEELPEVEKMEHDFFKPQPVKGAQIYYLRRVFHDWQDEEARGILKAIIPAMAPDSRILIADTALPEPVTIEDTNAVWMDLMMMTIGGKERTKKDWEGLIKSVGLRLVHVWQTPQTGPLAVVECMLQEVESATINGHGTGGLHEVTNGVQHTSVD